MGGRGIRGTCYSRPGAKVSLRTCPGEEAHRERPPTLRCRPRVDLGRPALQAAQLASPDSKPAPPHHYGGGDLPPPSQRARSSYHPLPPPPLLLLSHHHHPHSPPPLPFDPAPFSFASYPIPITVPVPYTALHIITMPVFATPASLRFRRATVSRPALAVAAAPDADADAAPVTDTETPPTSPITAFASPEADNAVLKARRAYDRDRQRAHQRRERARRELERSAPALPTTASLPAALHAHSREPSRRARLNAGFDAVASAKGEAFRSSPVEEIVADVVERAMLARAGGSPILGGAPAEVSLAQIARPAKARKSKGESGF